MPVPTAEGLTAPELDRITPLIAPAAILAGPGVTLPSAPPCPVLTDLAALMDHAPIQYNHGATPTGLPISSSPPAPPARPKPVAHAHRAIWARRMMWDGWYDLRPR